MEPTSETPMRRATDKLRPLPRWIFMSRWLQAPLYIGLIVAQGLYVVTVNVRPDPQDPIRRQAVPSREEGLFYGHEAEDHQRAPQHLHAVHGAAEEQHAPQHRQRGLRDLQHADHPHRHVLLGEHHQAVGGGAGEHAEQGDEDRKSTRLNSSHRT